MRKDYQLRTHPEYGYREVTPTPSNEEIARFYADEFYSSEYPRLNDSSLEVQERDKDFYDAFRRDLCDRIEALRRRPLSDLSVLDIGCGWGETLSYFKDRGMDCYGFDPAPEAIEYGRGKGLSVKCAGMDDLNVFGRRFDVVLMQNVLEHLAHPDQVMDVIRDQLLLPGGVLIIDVPNEFNSFQLSGRETHALDQWWVCPPNHLNYFTHRSLQKLVEGKGFLCRRLTSSFPLEMFLLFGHNYVEDAALGRRCHEMRMAFESNLRDTGRAEVLHDFYQSLAQLGLGRQILLFAQLPEAE